MSNQKTNEPLQPYDLNLYSKFYPYSQCIRWRTWIFHKFFPAKTNRKVSTPYLIHVIFRLIITPIRTTKNYQWIFENPAHVNSEWSFTLQNFSNPPFTHHLWGLRSKISPIDFQNARARLLWKVIYRAKFSPTPSTHHLWSEKFHGHRYFWVSARQNFGQSK